MNNRIVLCYNRRISTLESEVADILSSIRKSKPLLQDFCLQGISRGAPVEFIEKCNELEEYYTSQLTLRATPAGDACNTEFIRDHEDCLFPFARNLCELTGKQINLIRYVMEKAEKKGGVDESSLNQVSTICDIPHAWVLFLTACLHFMYLDSYSSDQRSEALHRSLA